MSSSRINTSSCSYSVLIFRTFVEFWATNSPSLCNCSFLFPNIKNWGVIAYLLYLKKLYYDDSIFWNRKILRYDVEKLFLTKYSTYTASVVWCLAFPITKVLINLKSLSVFLTNSSFIKFIASPLSTNNLYSLPFLFPCIDWKSFGYCRCFADSL